MLSNILNNAKERIGLATSLAELENVRVEYSGKKGVIAEQMKLLSQMLPEERKSFGEAVNDLKQQFEAALFTKKQSLENSAMNERLEKEKIDISLPATPHRTGSIHPIMQAEAELIEICAYLGFEVKKGPSIETEWYNFSALNIDANHPARQSHDTFYIGPKENRMVLRTHTSPVQIRTLESTPVPIKFIAPGRTYRSDFDQTHTPMFHQIELLAIDEHLTIRDLKAMIFSLISAFFESQNPEIRFRPSFFPFTTPSAEVDIKFPGGKWLEVLGCGMVHPQVLKNCHIDTSKYQAYAAGLGIERMAMLKYGIDDLRQFFDGDYRWLKHYSFSCFDLPSVIRGLSR